MALGTHTFADEKIPGGWEPKTIASSEESGTTSLTGPDWDEHDEERLVRRWAVPLVF